jgi:hypothetical protein
LTVITANEFAGTDARPCDTLYRAPKRVAFSVSVAVSSASSKAAANAVSVFLRS